MLRTACCKLQSKHTHTHSYHKLLDLHSQIYVSCRPAASIYEKKRESNKNTLVFVLFC